MPQEEEKIEEPVPEPKELAVDQRSSEIVAALAPQPHVGFPRQRFNKGDPLPRIAGSDGAGERSYHAVNCRAKTKKGHVAAGSCGGFPAADRERLRLCGQNVTAAGVLAGREAATWTNRNSDDEN